MSDKLPCNLLLGIQNVSLLVTEQEEACVRRAGNLVNRLVKHYEKETQSTDPNKIMALIALDLAMCGYKFESEHSGLHTSVLKENERLVSLMADIDL